MEGSDNLSMSDALQRLHDEVLEEIDKKSDALNKQRWLSRFCHSSIKTPYQWTATLQASIAAVLLLVAYGFSNDWGRSESIWLVIEACFLLLSIILNVYLTHVTTTQEKTEFVRLLQEVLKKLSACARYNTWNLAYFSKLEAPASPCCSLQWTMRDGYTINLPTTLLVRGDIILMRPGHHAPAMCQQIQSSAEDGQEPLLLHQGQVYCPDQEADTETQNDAQRREPLKAQQFLLLETPYLNYVRKVLADTGRPPSILDHERYFVLNKWVERRIIPAALFVIIVSNIVRYIMMKGHTGHWTEVLLTLQVQAVVPLFPVLLPVMWTILNYYGQARVFSAFEAAKGSKSLGDDSFDTDSSISADEARVDLPWRQVYDWFKFILLGRTQVVTRNINITHVMGSVTTLCCVDKKGILSFPNPTPEKIFFLHREQKDGKKATSVQSSVVPSRQSSSDNFEKQKQKFIEPVVGKTTCVEVLDVTSDLKSFGLHFDDPAWKQHLNSLKPLIMKAVNSFAANVTSVITYANSMDPDEMPSNSSSDQDPN